MEQTQTALLSAIANLDRMIAEFKAERDKLQIIRDNLPKIVANPPVE